VIFQVEETIAASPEDVWHHLTDPDCMTRWMAGAEDMRTVDGQPVRAGSDIVFSARGKERHTRVTEFEQHQCMTLRSTQGPVTAEYRYRIVETTERRKTTISLQANCTARGVTRIFMPLLKPMIRKADGNQLSDLKRLVEG
jgi:uncharacterized protein YndB with AHSA1/START domain